MDSRISLPLIHLKDLIHCPPKVINVKRKIEEAYKKHNISLPFSWTMDRNKADAVLFLVNKSIQKKTFIYEVVP